MRAVVVFVETGDERALIPVLSGARIAGRRRDGRGRELRAELGLVYETLEPPSCDHHKRVIDG
jgi:hypothetical protein